MKFPLYICRSSFTFTGIGFWCYKHKLKGNEFLLLQAECKFLLLLLHHNCRFTEFGGTVRQRPVEDLAFAVARFLQKGGSFINYYMVRTDQLHCGYFALVWTRVSVKRYYAMLFPCSTMEELILAVQLEVPLFQPAMIMMLLLMNLVRERDHTPQSFLLLL